MYNTIKPVQKVKKEKLSKNGFLFGNRIKLNTWFDTHCREKQTKTTT
jgi:hypothetical protein